MCNVSSQFFTKRKSIRDFKGGKEAKRKKKAFQLDEKQAKFPAHDKVAQVGKSGTNGLKWTKVENQGGRKEVGHVDIFKELNV